MHAFSVQLAWANELLEVHLQRACKQLLDTSTTANGDGTSQDLKLQLDALVKQITACFVGVQSCIPEPLSPAAARPSSGTSLTTPAQVLLLPISVHLMACGSCKTRVAAQYSSSHSEGCLKRLPCMSVIHFIFLALHVLSVAGALCLGDSASGTVASALESAVAQKEMRFCAPCLYTRGHVPYLHLTKEGIVADNSSEHLCSLMECTAFQASAILQGKLDALPS